MSHPTTITRRLAVAAALSGAAVLPMTAALADDNTNKSQLEYVERQDHLVDNGHGSKAQTEYEERIARGGPVSAAGSAGSAASSNGMTGSATDLPWELALTALGGIAVGAGGAVVLRHAHRTPRAA